MYLAVDIGGTKTLIALFSKRGRVLKKVKFRTARGAGRFIEDLTTNLELFRRFRVRAITVAIPGLVQKNYTVSFGNRDWDKIDLFTPIKNLFSCPIYFENDANLASLYEAYGLKGRTIFLTFSTGIGGGIVENNTILAESKDFEPGHKIYTYGGKTKEWEDLAAASALERVYHVDYATDLRGKEVMQDVAARIYLGVNDIIKEYRPDTIVLGGPLGKIFKLYAKYLPEVAGVRFKRPKRPTESVIYGCYLFSRSKE